jgi:hypothetical protein
VITKGTDKWLLVALDNLLRAVGTRDKFDGYHYSKLESAFKAVQQYLLSIGAENYAADRFEYNRHELLTIPIFQLNQLIIDFDGISCDLNFAAIELLATLYGQIKDISHCGNGVKVEITQAVTTNLFQYVDLGLTKNLNVRLPDKTDEIGLNDFRDKCENAWDKFGAEGQPSIIGFICAALARCSSQSSVKVLF